MPTLPAVAAYTARLGLATYALAGLITLTRPPLTPLHPGGYLSGYPALVAAMSGLCGLTWLAHRNARARATRTGAVLLLGAALAHAAYLTAPATTPRGPDLAAAGCTLILLGGVAGCALAGAGCPTPLAAGKLARQRRSVRVGLWTAAYAVFMSSFWASLDTTLPPPWVTLTLSICMWSADLNSHGGLTTHHPARQRAAALLGAMLLPTALLQIHLVHIKLSNVQLSHGLAAEASGHPILARLAAAASLALTLVLAASCWRLSRGHAHGRVDGRDTHCPADSTPTRPDRAARSLPGVPGHRPEPAATQSRGGYAGENRSCDPAGAPDSSSGPPETDAGVTGTATTRSRSRQSDTASALRGRAS